MVRPATAPESSSMTATLVGSMPRRTYSQKDSPATSAPSLTLRMATISEALSRIIETPSTAISANTAHQRFIELSGIIEIPSTAISGSTARQ